MCGLAGIYAYHYAANAVDREELLRMRDFMRSRGPDAEGAWFSADGRMAFGHRRLSIIDLSSAANQPMLSDDGSVVVNFNGEIYNYRGVREKLQREGFVFRTQSDTEVVLQCYRAYGDKMFAELRGMYAISVWDDARKALLLARDPFGIKPLYYADDGWTVRVASQVKALLAAGRVSRQLDPAGLVGFYLLGSVPEPFTLYREIRAVPAGGFVWVTSTGPAAPQQHFSVARVWADAEGQRLTVDAESNASDRVRAALRDTVSDHLVADVPVGAFLSSGIDSGALVGLMRDNGQDRIKTITVAFDEFQGSAQDESPLAIETARTYGTEHHVRRVTREEFFTDLPRVLDAMDQPTIDGLNTWFVAKATAEQGLKVAVSGLGGDEMFGGYPSFREVPRWARTLWLPSRLPGASRLLRSMPLAMFPNANPKFRGVLHFGRTYPGAWFLKRGLFMPWELPAILDSEFVDEGLRRLSIDAYLARVAQPQAESAFARVATLESSLYMRNQLLRDTDWASMAHSLEVRVPYVDPILLRVVAAAARSGETPGKCLLASSPSTPLPAAVTQRAKTGFGMPVAQWLQEKSELDVWRRVPELRVASCPWARRWSHVIGSRFAGMTA